MENGADEGETIKGLNIGPILASMKTKIWDHNGKAFPTEPQLKRQFEPKKRSKSHVKEALREIHDETSGSHLGVKKTHGNYEMYMFREGLWSSIIVGLCLKNSLRYRWTFSCYRLWHKILYADHWLYISQSVLRLMRYQTKQSLPYPQFPTSGG